MKKIILIILILGIILISGCKTNLPKDYNLNVAEGICSKASDCVYAGDSCGGGHGICTNQPEKYENLITTCEIIPSHPINNGYSCTCIEALGKCGWVK